MAERSSRDNDPFRAPNSIALSSSPPRQHLFGKLGSAARCRPGAFGEANGTAQRFTEIEDAFIEIDEPFLGAPDHLFIIEYCVRRTSLGADLTVCAEILGSDIDGMIGNICIGHYDHRRR